MGLHTLTLDDGEGPLLAHRFLNVMKNRISWYFILSGYFILISNIFKGTEVWN